VDRFSAVLGGEEGERPTVELPFDAKQRYGEARAPVRGTVNGAAFRTTVAVYSGLHLIGFNKEVRDRAGVEIGDEVTVELERDDEPREVDVPPELGQALAARPGARDAFEGLLHPPARVRGVDRRRKAPGDARAPRRPGSRDARGRPAPPLEAL